MSLCSSFDYDAVVKTSGTLQAVCLPTHKFKPADLELKSIDSLAMCLDSLQEQDKTGIFNPERLHEMLLADGNRPLTESKGSGRAKARTEATPTASTPPWRADSAKAPSKAAPVPPVPTWYQPDD